MVDEAAALLAGEAEGLEAAGARLLLLCTNAMHVVTDLVQSAVGIPLLQITAIAAEAARRAGLDTVG